jgi:hypothetical protein
MQRRKSARRLIISLLFLASVAVPLFVSLAQTLKEPCFSADPGKPLGETRRMGVPPVVALVGDGKISAGFSRDGTLVTFFYPTVGAYDMVPYYTEGGEELNRFGAEEHFGAQLGLVSFRSEEVGGILGYGTHDQPKADVTWLSDCQSVRHSSDCPAFTFSYRPIDNVSVQFTTFALIDDNALVYEIRVTNTGAPKRVGLAYYAFFDPSKLNQHPVVATGTAGLTMGGWKSTGYTKVSFAEECLTWRKESSAIGYAIGFDGHATDGGDATTVYVEAGRADYLHRSIPLDFSGGFHIRELTDYSRGVYRTTYDLGELPQDNTEWPLANTDFSKWFNSIWQYNRQNLNGVVIWDLGEMATGTTRSFRIVVAAGDDQAEVRKMLKGMETVDHLEAVRAWWKAFLDGLTCKTKPQSMSDKDFQLLQWWAMTLRLLADRKSGAIVAAPILIPQYYGCWPRDGAMQAIAWIELGQKEIARKFFDYLFSIPDFTSGGKWFQCYSSDGGNPEYVGLPLSPIKDCAELGLYDGKVLEEDQMSLVLLAIEHYRAKFGELPRIDGIEQRIRTLAEYIASTVSPGNGGKREMKATVTLDPNFEQNMDLLTSGTVVATPVAPLLPTAIVTGWASIKALSKPTNLTIHYLDGLVRPSSDAYEFPGPIGSLDGMMDLLLGQKVCSGVCGSRQSAYANFAAAEALDAAADMLKDETFRTKSTKLLSVTKSTYWQVQTCGEVRPPRPTGGDPCNRAGYFYAEAYDILTGEFYGIDSWASKYHWPLGVLSIWNGSKDDLDDLSYRIYLTCEAFRSQLAHGCQPLFVPDLLPMQIYRRDLIDGRKLDPATCKFDVTDNPLPEDLGTNCKDDYTTSAVDYMSAVSDACAIIKVNPKDHLASTLEIENGYLPESIDGSSGAFAAFKTNTYPLGWSHAMGIHLLLQRHFADRPKVVSTVPSDNESGVAVTTTVAATFDRQMISSTFNVHSMTLAEITSGYPLPVQGEVSYDPTNRRVEFTPTVDLLPRCIYRARLARTISSCQGKELASEITWSFTTSAAYNPHAGALGLQAVCAETYMSNSSMLRGYRTLCFGSWLHGLSGVSWSSFTRAELSKLHHSEIFAFTTVGGEILPGIRFTGGLGYKQIHSTLPSYSNRDMDSVWSPEGTRDLSGPLGVIGLAGSNEIGKTSEDRAEIWGLITVASGVLNGHLYDIDVRVMAGIRFWRKLTFTQALDYEISASTIDYRSSYQRLAWGLGFGVTW